jgi:HEAT repeat protein
MSQDLIEQLQNHSYEKRIEAVERLKEKGDLSSVPALLHLASDQEESLWRGTHKGELIHPNAAEHPRYYAHKAVEVLSQSTEGFIALRDSLTHRDSLIRSQAAWGLGHYQREYSEDEDNLRRESLRNALQDPEIGVVLQSIRSLTVLQEIDKEIMAGIFELLSGPSATLQWAALQALGLGIKELSDEDSLALVSVMLDDEKTKGMRSFAARCLARSTSEDIIGPLIAMLTEEDESLREQAALTLGTLKSEEATTPLFQVLIDSDEHVRYAAGIALGKIGDTRTIPFLLKARRYGDEIIKKHALETINMMGDAALEDLVEAMRNENMPYRQDAVIFLEELANPNTVYPLIEALLEDEIYHDARRALLAIGEAAIKPLVFVGANTQAPPVFQEKCIRLLSEIDKVREVKEGKKTLLAPPRSHEMLMKQLESEEPSIRMLCSRVLGQFSYPTAIPSLLSVVEKGDAELEGVVSEAMISLGKFDFSQFERATSLPDDLEINFENPDLDAELAEEEPPKKGGKKTNAKKSTKKATKSPSLSAKEITSLRSDVVSVLVTGLDHFSSKIRASSIVALGNMGDVAVVDDLISRVTDPTKDNRVLMIQALAKLGDPKASKALFSILEEAKLQSLAGTSGSYLGFHCVQALAKLGQGEVVQYLLQDWNQDMEVAMEALGEKALPYLERTVQNSKDGHIRALAVQAMGLIGSKDVMGTLVTALRDTDERVRDAAAYSLNQIF